MLYTMRLFLDKYKERYVYTLKDNMILFTSMLALVLYGLMDYTFAGYGAMRLYWLIMGICAAGICCTRSCEK